MLPFPTSSVSIVNSQVWRFVPILALNSPRGMRFSVQGDAEMTDSDRQQTCL